MGCTQKELDDFNELAKGFKRYEVNLGLEDRINQMRILQGRTGRRMFIGTKEEEEYMKWWEEQVRYLRHGKTYTTTSGEQHQLSGLGYSLMHQAEQLVLVSPVSENELVSRALKYII